MTLLDDLLDLQIPTVIKISPNGQQVVYSTSLVHGHKSGDHEASTLWLAEIGKAQSARRLTAGKYNDREPRWSPDGQSIAFLSDRGKQGEACAIYTMPVNFGGEPLAITPAEHERTIDRFEFSPDGKSIAFLVADEKTEEKKKREKEKEDANVWGQDWPFHRLRLVDILSKEVTVLVSKEAHLLDLAWSDDGARLAFTETKTPHIESEGTAFHVYDLQTKYTRKLCDFSARRLIAPIIWPGDSLYFIGPCAETGFTSDYMVFEINTSNEVARYEKRAHGETDSALRLVKAGRDVFVYVQAGMQDQIRVLGGQKLFGKKRALLAGDAAFTKDSDEVVLVVAQGDSNSPTEVFSTTASGGAMVQLSALGEGIKDQEFGRCTFISCQSLDGKVTLECPWLTSAKAATDANGLPSSPLPTVVMVHGGPYSRHTEAFDGLYFMWAPYLLAAGYSILLADYRGSSGRGEAWAACARGVGKVDYEDVIALTNEAIEKGFADKSRLIIGGWSQGGYLSYLASVRNGTHGLGWEFKAAIPGAGVVDWDTMTFTSDIGRWEAEMGTVRPWKASKDDTRNRGGSAIWEFSEAIEKAVPIPPMLILHGEQDKRVPLEQAVAMRRALEDADLPFEYVTYPREEHIIKERKHYVDMAERVKAWVDKHIGPP